MAQKQPQKNPLEKLKGLDAGGLSLCESELTRHINRSAFTAKMWANADKKEIDQHPKSMTAENFRMIRTSRGSTVISFLVHWFQRKMTQFPMSGKMTMTLFYL